MPASTAICGANDTLNRGSLKTSSDAASDAASVIRMVSIAARSRSGRNRQSDNASPTTAAIMIAAYNPIVNARHRLLMLGRMISTAPNDSLAPRPSSLVPKVAQNFFAVRAGIDSGSAAM